MEKPSKTTVQQKRNGVLLCLCLTAASISAPLNGLSPSLSLVALDFGFDQKQRDVYLGGYMGLATMIGQMIGSGLSGVYVDFCPRRRMLVLALIVGSFAMVSFGSMPILEIMLFLRILTGGCQGAIVPILFSLIGDYYAVDERATASAIVSSCLGGGMMLGQLFTGYMLDSIGWRTPFVVMGVFAGLMAYFVHFTLKEPVRGAKEEELGDVLSRGASLPPLTISTFFKTICIPTVSIMVLQTLPNTVPWGVLSTHLHDFLATDEHLSMNAATSLIAMFGAGAAFGGLFGGFLGGKMYAISRASLPVFMGSTIMVSALLLKRLLNMDMDSTSAGQIAMPILIVSGALAAVNGANVRVVVINLTSPEARGAIIALLNFVNNAGRGTGPFLIDMWMQLTGATRKVAVTTFLDFWLVSGCMMVIASITIARDEDRMRMGLKRFAEEASAGLAVNPLKGSGTMIASQKSSDDSA
jgi:MFS family permease